MEIMTSPIVVITAVTLLAAFVVVVYGLSCWRQRNMRYFTYLSLAVAINVLGYFLEITAPTLEAAIVACKVAYVGVPLSGLLLFLFSLDYSDRISLNRVWRTVFFCLAPVFTLAVFLYPEVPLFYEDLSFSTEGLVPHLVVSPGPLYYPCILYASLFSILAFINLMISFVNDKRHEGAVIFVIAILLPLFSQAYTMVFGLVEGWNPQRTTLTISLVLLALYLARYKQAEWQSVGRELVVQDMEDAFILINNKGVVIDKNLAAERYFPVLKEKRRKHRISELGAFAFDEFLEYGTHHMDVEQEGTTKNLKITVEPLAAKGEKTGTLIIISDNTATSEMMQELTRMARIDELTGLKNRATFFQDATLSFGLALRQEENQGCALMMDIDYFKNINDTYGHAVGDEVLRFIGALINRRFRHTDICGRYGGEELSVWMPATTLESAVQVAEEIRSLVEAKIFEHEGAQFNVTISIGIACMRESGSDDFEDLVKKADFALYEAKHSGRNKVCVFTKAGQ